MITIIRQPWVGVLLLLATLASPARAQSDDCGPAAYSIRPDQPIASNLRTLSIIHAKPGSGEEPRDFSDVVMFPNPARSQMTLQLTDKAAVTEIRFTTANGAQVEVPVMRDLADGYRYNLSRLANGLYFARVSYADGQRVYKKFIKTK